MKKNCKQLFSGLLALGLMAGALPVWASAQTGDWVLEYYVEGQIGDPVIPTPDPDPEPNPDPGPGGSSGGTNNNSSGGSDRRDSLDGGMVLIDENGVPLGFYVEDEDGNLIFIPAEDVPLGTLPETGDNSRLLPAATGLLLASATILWSRRKKPVTTAM